MKDDDPRVTALQLLLSDADDKTVHDLFCTAFPNTFLPITAYDAWSIMGNIEAAKDFISNILEQTSAQENQIAKNARFNANAAQGHIQSAETLLRRHHNFDPSPMTKEQDEAFNAMIDAL